MAPGLPSAFGSLRLGVGGVEGCGSSHSVVGGEHVLWEPTLAPGPVSASRGLCPSSVSTPEACRAPPRAVLRWQNHQGSRHGICTGFEKWIEHLPFG